MIILYLAVNKQNYRRSCHLGWHFMVAVFNEGPLRLAKPSRLWNAHRGEKRERAQQKQKKLKHISVIRLPASVEFIVCSAVITLVLSARS